MVCLKVWWELGVIAPGDKARQGLGISHFSLELRIKAKKNEVEKLFLFPYNKVNHKLVGRHNSCLH